MIPLFTIGFTGKTAEDFFARLKNAGVCKVIDTRRWPDTQLSGFAKKRDLPYLLRELTGIVYEHHLPLAPDDGLLRDIKNRVIDWPTYEQRYINLLRGRRILDAWGPDKLDHICLLCAEATAEQCHRRLLADYLRDAWPDQNIQIHHL